MIFTLLTRFSTRQVASRISTTFLSPSITLPSFSTRQFVKMSGIDTDIAAKLEQLKVANSEVLQHVVVKGGPEWKAALESAGKTDLSMTKTVNYIALIPS